MLRLIAVLALPEADETKDLLSLLALADTRSTKKARKASYWRCRGVAGSMKKRRAFVRSNGAPIATYHVVTYYIWCQAGNSRTMAGLVENARPIVVFGATTAKSRCAAHRPQPQVTAFI